MNRDTLTGIIGAVILVGAMVGVFQYERTVGAARAGILDAEFEVASFDGPSADGRTALGETTEEALALDEPGMVNVTFTLTWTAEQGANGLRLEVVPPEGVDAPTAVTGDSGTLTLKVPVPNAEPQVRAPTETGAGTWTVRVTFESAEGVDTPAGRVGGDGEVAWALTTQVDAWRAVPDA